MAPRGAASSSVRRGLVVAAAVLAGLGVASATARADVVERSSVRLDSSGYGFGGNTRNAGVSSDFGALDWKYEGAVVHAHLVGNLYMDGVDGSCANMRLDYRDADGATLATRRGGQVCVDDNHQHAFGVDLDEYQSHDIASVKISVEKTVGTTTSTAVSQVQTLQFATDPVEITTHGVDLGNPNWDSVLSVPGGPAVMAWDIVDGVLRPHLVATIHLNNSKNVCARVNLRYYDESGNVLDHHAGGPACATGNDHEPFSVDLDPYSNNKIDHVTVQLQTENADGSWSVIGHDTVDIAA